MSNHLRNEAIPVEQFKGDTPSQLSRIPKLNRKIMILIPKPFFGNHTPHCKAV